MKTTLTTILASAFMITLASGLQAQIKKVMVNSVDINAIKEVHYVQLLGVLENKKMIIEVDYGQQLSDKDQVITSADGKPHHFESMVDALNFMYENGWEFLNAYEIKSADGDIYHFLLKKKE